MDYIVFSEQINNKNELNLFIKEHFTNQRKSNFANSRKLEILILTKIKND